MQTEIDPQSGSKDLDLNKYGFFQPLVFTVARRLRSLGHRLGVAAPAQQNTYSPQHSISAGTKEVLKSESNLCLGHASPPNKETGDTILSTNIDEEKIENCLTNAITDGDLPSILQTKLDEAFKGVRNEYILPKKSNNDGGKEAPYTSLLRQFLHSIIALVSVTILQLWVDEVGDDLPAYVAILALSLDFDEEPLLKDPNNNPSKPDFVIRGDDPAEWGVSDPGKIIISTIDSKNSSNAGQIYSKENMSKDQYISHLVGLPSTLSTTLATLPPHSWRAHTLHLLAQMYTQAETTRSKSSLFTSLYGFMRVAIAQPNLLHISPNIMIGDKDDSARRDINVNSNIMKECFLFIFGSVVRSYGPEVILPPLFRQDYRNPTFTELIPQPSSSSLQRGLTQLSSSVRSQLSSTKAWFWSLALQVCSAQVLACTANFAVPFLSGNFERLDNRGWLSPIIPFTIGENRDGRFVGLNKDLGLVIKIFLGEDAFNREWEVYKVLSESGCLYVPQFYGSFENRTLELFAILISYEGQEVDGLLTERDREHLRTAITGLHSAGVHHHDLKQENLVRGQDGELKLIDFHLSEILDESTCPPNVCPDWQWIQGL